MRNRKTIHRGRRAENDRDNLSSHKLRSPFSIFLCPDSLLHVVHTSPILRPIKLGFCKMKLYSIIPTKLSDTNYNPSGERYYPGFFTEFRTWEFQVLNVQYSPWYTSGNTSESTDTVSIKNMRRKRRLSLVQVTEEKGTYFTIYFPIHSGDHFDKILKHHGSYNQRQGETQLI